jgi:hypothetical protein
VYTVSRALRTKFFATSIGKGAQRPLHGRLAASGVASVALLGILDLLRSLAHAPTRESFHRVVVVLLVITGVLIAATLLALAVRLPLEAMLAG